MTFENIVAKEEIAHYNEQFLLLQQCFQLYFINMPLSISGTDARLKGEKKKKKNELNKKP